MKEDAEMLLMVTDHYRRLWTVLEDLETLLWQIKDLNEDLAGGREAED